MAKLYLPLDVMFFDDEKIAAVGERPAWLYLAMCCKAKQLGTDGYLTEQQVVKLAVPGWKARLRPLLAERLVVLTGGRYFIPAWTNWNETAEQVAERRRKDRERKAVPLGIQTESERNPNGVRADSLLSEVKEREVPPDVTHQSLDVASVDARKHDDGLGHSPAGSITALYAAGVPLSDHGRAHRVIAEALAHYPAEAVRSGVLRLVAERRTCTLDTLRIAIHSDDAPAVGTAPPHRRTATEKASQWLTVGLDDEAPPQLRAIPGGLT